MHTDTKKNDEMIKSINEYLGRQKMDLVWLGCILTKIYEVSDKEQFFVKESLLQKFKTIAAFLAAAIPIIVSIIKLIAERRNDETNHLKYTKYCKDSVKR